jgi:hypothetical protein
MRKLFFAVALCVVFQITPLFAQRFSQGKESEFFYVNVPIEKVYPYRKGYVIQYRKGVNQMARTYLPIEWFEDAGDKGDLIYLSSGNSWPYLTVYYKNGEFSHVRLYLRRDRAHASWGNITLGVNIDDRFENVDDLKLEF